MSFSVSRCHSISRRESRFFNRDIPRPGESGNRRETDLFNPEMEFFNDKGEKVHLVVDDSGRDYFWLNEVGEWCVSHEFQWRIFQPFVINLHVVVCNSC